MSDFNNEAFEVHISNKGQLPPTPEGWLPYVEAISKGLPKRFEESSTIEWQYAPPEQGKYPFWDGLLDHFDRALAALRRCRR
jgi:hypothetical protein